MELMEGSRRCRRSRNYFVFCIVHSAFSLDLLCVRGIPNLLLGRGLSESSGSCRGDSGPYAGGRETNVVLHCLISSTYIRRYLGVAGMFYARLHTDLKVYGYFHRRVFSICFILAALWPLTYGEKFWKRNKFLVGSWALCCLVMSSFTLLPVVKQESLPLMFVPLSTELIR